VGGRSSQVVRDTNLLDGQFVAERPNQKWIADFTYIWTAEGWLYVSAVIDLFSRRVIGWRRGNPHQHLPSWVIAVAGSKA
jgi:putative transposase